MHLTQEILPQSISIRKAIEQFHCWPSLKDDVAQWVRTCAGCLCNKSTNRKQAGLLQPLPVPNRKWGSVSMDLITALPETASGNTAIVVFVDRLIRWLTWLHARLSSILKPLQTSSINGSLACSQVSHLTQPVKKHNNSSITRCSFRQSSDEVHADTAC